MTRHVRDIKPTCGWTSFQNFKAYI